MPTLQSPKHSIHQFNCFIFSQTLDILLGNIQFLIVKLHHMHLRDTPIDITQLIYAFDHRMAESVNKIHNRMRKPPYIKQWIYSRPRFFPSQQITHSNWVQAIIQLLKDSVLHPQSRTSNDTLNQILLTSALDSQLSSDI
jgi:hypothetical protein